MRVQREDLKMTITQEQAEYLLALPKKITEGDDVTINLKNDRIRLELYSPGDADWKFLLQIASNMKITFRINFHHLENSTKEGLLRIDFKSGQHKNPEDINSFVPEFLRPYAGAWLNESHIHFFVEGYQNLAWALPLREYDDFPIKRISTFPEFAKATRIFMEKINVVSNIPIQGALL